MLALKHYFSRNEATVLMLDDLTADVMDKTVHSVAHAVTRLEELSPSTGPSAGGCACSSTAGGATAAVISIS